MGSSNGPSKLFVGDIGDNRKQDISRIFSKYGEISTIYVDDYKHFAFVEYTSSGDAKHALKHTNNKTVNGARLRVEYAKSDKPSRDKRRALSREHSPTAALYNHLQVTANRLPPMQAVRQNYYQHYPSPMMTNPAMSRGRSLTPPSFKQNSRLPSMNHLRTPDFYPAYYPPHPAVYADPAYYRAYGDPYLMQRLPPPPAFLPSASPPPPSSSSSRAYRNVYSSSGLDRYPPVMSHKRSRRSRSRSRRRTSPSRKNQSNRERKHKRRTPSSSSPRQQRERGPQTPPPSHRNKKRSRSESDTAASTSEQKSSSSSSSEDETNEDQQSNSKRSPDTDSNRKHSSRRRKD